METKYKQSNILTIKDLMDLAQVSQRTAQRLKQKIKIELKVKGELTYYHFCEYFQIPI